MPGAGERWPPVYDLEDLVAEIRRLSVHPRLAEEFYEWRRDRSVQAPEDVCQGDVLWLASDVPIIFEDGLPGVLDHPGQHWLVIGNSCDLARPSDQAAWTQVVPLISVGDVGSVAQNELAAVQRYTQSRRFYVPAWSAAVDSQIHIADLLRPVPLDKRALEQPEAKAFVQARLSRAAWILLNACLVRFLARDDGRYD